MASGFRNFNLTFGSRIVTLLMAVGTQSCLAWFLGPSGRGSYAVCLVFASLFSIIFAVGCDIASTYFVSAKRFSVSEGVTYVLIYGGISSGLAIIAGLIVMQLPLAFFDKATPSAFYLALVTIPTSLFSLTFMRLLTAIDQFGCFAIMSVIDGVAKLVLSLVFVGVFSWGVNGALLAILVAGVVTTLSTLLLFLGRYSATLVMPSVRKLLDMLNYGLRYYIGKLSNRLNFQIGTIILAFFATNEEVGLFATALQITAQIMIIPDILTIVLIPRIAGDEMGKKQLVAQCARLAGLVCGVLLLTLAVFAKPIVVILLSPVFLPAAPLIQILAIGVSIRCACKVFVPYLVGTNHPGIASMSVLTGTLVNLGIVWVLFPIMGLVGAALGLMISYFVTSAILTITFSQLGELSLTEIWRYRRSDLELLVKFIKPLNPVHKYIIKKSG